MSIGCQFILRFTKINFPISNAIENKETNILKILLKPNSNAKYTCFKLPFHVSHSSFSSKRIFSYSSSICPANHSETNDPKNLHNALSEQSIDSSDVEETFRMLSRFPFREVDDEDVYIVLKDFQEKKPHRNKIPYAKETIKILLGIGINFQEASKIILRNPVLLNHNPYQYLLPKLCVFLDYGMSMQEVQKSIISDSTIANCSIEHIESALKYLVEEVQLKNVGRVIKQCPITVRYGAQSLKPKLESLKNMGIEDLQKAIERYPRVLGYNSLELDRKANLLRELMERQDISNLVQTMPLLLGSNSSTSTSTFDWMVSKFTKPNAIHMINQSPGILLMRKETLEPKFNFICETMGRDRSEIVKTPSVLMYSLEKRMRLRYETLLSYGIKKKYSLGHLFCSASRSFEGLFKVKLPIPSQKIDEDEFL